MSASGTSSLLCVQLPSKPFAHLISEFVDLLVAHVGDVADGVTAEPGHALGAELLVAYRAEHDRVGDTTSVVVGLVKRQDPPCSAPWAMARRSCGITMSLIERLVIGL